MRKILAGAAVLAVAAGVFYFGWNGRHGSGDQRATLARPVPQAPVVETICVEPIQNLSHQTVKMDGVEDELVAQLQKVGFGSSRRSSAAGKQCDAFINAELVEVSGRDRKTARVDFRLTLASEQPPRMSATAIGKSTQLAKFVATFHGADAAEIDKERDAVLAAVDEQARQIHEAYKRGLPPWLQEGQ